MNKQIVFLVIMLWMGHLAPAAGQSSTFVPQKIELSDTILRNSIIKYQMSVTEREIMVVARESRSDSVKYYISAINSRYKLFKNIPSAYTQVGNKYIFLYTGLEHIATINDTEKNRFVSQFKDLLRNDILPDGKTLDPESIGNYDPIQCLIVVKNGKKVYEDFKKGFGKIGGMPYLINK